MRSMNGLSIAMQRMVLWQETLPAFVWETGRGLQYCHWMGFYMEADPTGEWQVYADGAEGRDLLKSHNPRSAPIGLEEAKAQAEAAALVQARIMAATNVN